MDRKAPSKIRKIYTAKLISRCILFVLGILCYLFYPNAFSILEGASFFRDLSPLHLIWLIWMGDMLLQILPARAQISLGSQKHFLFRFKPIKDKIHVESLKKYIISTTKSAYKVFLLWAVVTIVLGLMYHFRVISREIMFLISLFYYVCDLICVLIWCPFRLITKTRCCTTCRIFNWDHLMMFSHLIFIGGFYGLSLFCMGLLVFLVWEVCVFLYPERFWEMTNTALRCSECTDKLCTQYCQKLRPAKNATQQPK